MYNRHYVMSAETKEKLSEKMKGNKNSVGHVLSPTSRKKISEKMKGNQNGKGKRRSKSAQ